MVNFACVALVDPRGHVLMQERDDQTTRWPDRWAFPGGAAEPGELGVTCAVREFAEETGVHLDPGTLTSLGTRPVRLPDGSTRAWEFFVARTALGQDEIDCREGRRMLFVDPARWREMEMIPTTGNVLELLTVWMAANPAKLGERRFAGALLTDARGWLLLQERDEHARIDPEAWGLPGGHVEPGESFAAAAPRELAEETGLVLDSGRLTFWREFVVDHRAAHGTWDTMQIFVAETTLSDDDVECHEGRRIIFVDPATLPTLALTKAAQQILPEFLGHDALGPAAGSVANTATGTAAVPASRWRTSGVRA